MPDTPPDTPVAHGDRRNEVWIETDPRQLAKVRHTWPAGSPPLQEQSESLAEGVDPALAEATDAAVVPEEPSAWEAVEAEDEAP